ncbi:MAG: dTMP kinase [Oligoflexales bacterium]|nr:dTMP kinase [Oligoflexales bacterium]
MTGSSRGCFITIEGGEGVGKSQLIRSLADFLQKAAPDSIITREPGGTPLADEIRAIFAHPPQGENLNRLTELLLMSAARSHHVEKLILPALLAGRSVLSDRFADSSRVYQGSLGALDSEFVENLIAKSTFGLEPDLTLLLDCDVKEAQKRISSRIAVLEKVQGSVENKKTSDLMPRFDQQDSDFHEKIRQAFLQLANTYNNRILVLDASLKIEDVAQKAQEAILIKLAQPRRSATQLRLF